MDKATLLWDLLKYIGVIGNLIGLMVWGHHSIEMYLENPTASSVIMNYGDEGDMQTRFPVITICQKDNHRQIFPNGVRIWNDQAPCNKHLETPILLTYLQGCLEQNPDYTIEDILANVTYSKDDLIKNVTFIGIDDGPAKRLQDHHKWNEVKEKVIYDMFDIEYGHCFTIDISPLTEKGTVPIQKIYVPVEMVMFLDLSQDKHALRMFLHNGSDIFSLHQNLPQVDMTPGTIELKIKKTIIDTLPTKKYKCVRNHFETCLLNSIHGKTIRDHNCSIPFIAKNSKFKTCSRDIILNISQTIKDLVSRQNHDDTEKFGECEFGKPCQDMIYGIADKDQLLDNDSKMEARVTIKFENMLVEIIRDSYRYPFISLFAEVGGVLGMLLGLSIFGIFETCLSQIQRCFKCE